MSLWQRLVGRRRVVTRLVVAVVLAMGVVLVLASSFVYWRVSFALDRQVDQDLAAWRSVAVRAVAAGTTPPTDAPGVGVQVYDARGRLLVGRSGTQRLLSPSGVRDAVATGSTRFDTGRLLPARRPAYRVQVDVVATRAGDRVVASLISRSKRDEALRELLLQLTIADLLALAAAGFVGYRTARAALDPVEAYRRAAATAGLGGRLPVAEDREDELTRLGHTFNELLSRLAAGAERERRFLADASHELRSPLALMRTELEWAGHRPRSAEELARVLASMRDQVDRLVALGNALLELEEVRGAGPLARADVALPDLVADAVRDAGVTGSVAPVVDVPDVVVHVDRRWATIAVANLVANAHRHAAGPVRVTAGHDPTAGSTRLVVSDEGPGFDDDFREAAFERFRRADQSRTTPGSGLGLALVRSIAQAHGGTARVLAPDGSGAPGAAVELVLAGTTPPAPEPGEGGGPGRASG